MTEVWIATVDGYDCRVAISGDAVIAVANAEGTYGHPTVSVSAAQVALDNGRLYLQEPA